MAEVTIKSYQVTILGKKIDYQSNLIRELNKQIQELKAIIEELKRNGQ